MKLTSYTFTKNQMWGELHNSSTYITDVITNPQKENWYDHSEKIGDWNKNLALLWAKFCAKEFFEKHPDISDVLLYIHPMFEVGTSKDSKFWVTSRGL